jgi:hypothetical protein
MRDVLYTITIFCWLCAGSVAQQSQSGGLPDAPSASAQSQTAQQPANKLQSGMVFLQLLERKSLVFPDLATNTGPLDPWQKFKLAANSSVSLATGGSELIGSAFGQAINSPAQYGQGAEGYGKRFGAGMARAASQNLFGTFLLASALHEDPRFYVKKGLSFKASVKYAAVRVAITRSDSGDRVVNYSGLLGPLAGETLAETYCPAGNRGISHVVARYASDLGWKFGGNVVRQYWSKINKKVRLLPAVPES